MPGCHGDYSHYGCVLLMEVRELLKQQEMYRDELTRIPYGDYSEFCVAVCLHIDTSADWPKGLIATHKTRR